MPAQLYVNGKSVKAKSSKLLDIRNPATLELIEQVPDCGQEDVNAAVAAAKAAQRDWDKTPAIEKATLLHEVARRIRTDEHGLSETMCAETGKPIWEARDCIEWVAACFDYYAEIGRASRGQSLPPVARHQVNFTIKEPYGVVAAIVPFNFPLLLMSWKVAPAIMAGNTVVCKPPHQNPLSNLRLASAYSALPPGVVNIITGTGETGSVLVDHPDVNLIAFTGSTAVGRQIASRAGAQLKKVNLELGGIDPFIVFEDADLDVAVPGVAWARLLNAGQVCTSSKRIYLVKPITKDFTDRLLQYVDKLKIGDPKKPEIDIGPLISKDALEKVEKQVQTAIKEGAKVLRGGKRIQPEGLKGHFYEPTVLTNVRHGGICTREEVFGPIVSLIEVNDADEAIERANDSAFGLGANIYTRNLEYAMKAMDNIKAGTFWINDP